MSHLLALAALLLVGGALAAVVAVVAARVVRLRAERRREALAAGPRKALLAYLAAAGGGAPTSGPGASDIPADGGPADQLPALVDIPAPAWRAVEPAATALLAKVRGEARDALALVFERRGVGDRALADLSARTAVRRARGAEILGSLRRRDAVPALCARLADRDPEVRLVAVRALGRIGDPAGAEPLLATLAAPNPAPVHLVAHALVQLAAGADPALLDALTNPAAQVRATVLDTLRLRGTTGAETRVVAALRSDESVEVRRRAAAVLGRVGGRGALDPLVEAAGTDPSMEVRAEAARALGELGLRAAVPALRKLLGDPRYQVAHASAGALLRLGEPGLIALREAAAEPGDAAAHAEEALAVAALTGTAALPGGAR